jgi:HlyD family secretion protein
VAGAAAALGAGDTAIPGAGRQTVWIENGGRLRSIAIRTGISDGRFTEIVEGDLKPGDQVVVGQATSKVDSTTRPPGGGRMF